MITQPPPPDYSDVGPLALVAADFARHIDGELRRSWTSESIDLEVSDDGRIRTKGYPWAHFEDGGLRSILVRYNDFFPRAYPVLSGLTWPTFALVWRDLFKPRPDDIVRVHERRGAVYAVSTAGFGAAGSVGLLVGDLPTLFPKAPPMALIEYNAADLSVSVLLAFEKYNVRIRANDRPEGEGVSVRVETKAGDDLGDPMPDVKRRRREGTSTVLEGINAKLAAAAAKYK